MKFFGIEIPVYVQAFGPVILIFVLALTLIYHLVIKKLFKTNEKKPKNSS